jgi:hypothetical protein
MLTRGWMRRNCLFLSAMTDEEFAAHEKAYVESIPSVGTGILPSRPPEAAPEPAPKPEDKTDALYRDLGGDAYQKQLELEENESFKEHPLECVDSGSYPTFGSSMDIWVEELGKRTLTRNQLVDLARRIIRRLDWDPDTVAMSTKLARLILPQALQFTGPYEDSLASIDVLEGMAKVGIDVSAHLTSPTILYGILDRTGNFPLEAYLPYRGLPVPAEEVLREAYGMFFRAAMGGRNSYQIYPLYSTSKIARSVLEPMLDSMPPDKLREYPLPLSAHLLSYKEASERFIETWQGSSTRPNPMAFHMGAQAAFGGPAIYPGPSVHQGVSWEPVMPEKTAKAVVGHVTAMHANTQATLAEDIRNDQNAEVDTEGGTVILYRGIESLYSVRRPLESWSSDTLTAGGFDGCVVLAAVVPFDAILTFHESPTWNPGDTMGEYEYIVITSRLNQDMTWISLVKDKCKQAAKPGEEFPPRGPRPQ